MKYRVVCTPALLGSLLTASLILAETPRDHRGLWLEMNLRGDDVLGADFRFSSGFESFYRGPAWLLDALSMPSFSRARLAPMTYDSAGDRAYSAIDAGPFTDASMFNFFADVNSYLRTQERISPSAPDATFYTWIGANGGAWNVNTNWTPGGFPNAPGDIAFNDGFVSTTVNQNTPGGVTIGTIYLDADFNDTSWTIATITPITIEGDPSAIAPSIRNESLSSGANNALIITGTGGLILAADTRVICFEGTNPNGSIQFDTPISGTGDLHLVNLASNNPNFGQIAFLQANTYVGSTFIEAGVVTFNHAQSFGNAANIVTLGPYNLGSVSLLSAAGVTLPNPIVVAAGTLGTSTLGGHTASSTSFTGTVTLNGNVTLTSATTVESGIHRVTKFANTISGNGNVTVTGTSTSVGFVEFSAGNTYLGNTTVNSGTLLVNNPAGTFGTGSVGEVKVNNGGTLGGTGFINTGANVVHIDVGGRITGGTNGAVATDGAVGTLTMTTPALLLPGTFLVDIHGPVADRLNLLPGLMGFTNVDLSALTDAISFNIVGAPTASSYTLIHIAGAGGFLGTFSNVSGLPDGYILQYNTHDLLLVAIPEPGTWIGAALALAAMAFAGRKRWGPKKILPLKRPHSGSSDSQR